LYVSIEAAPEFKIEVHGASVDSIPTGPDNLIVRVAKKVAQQRSLELPPFRLDITNEIPVACGLGSSATAIIAGISCYECMTGDRLNDDEIFRYAFEFEAHPDNLAPALYGGLISAATSSNGGVAIARLNLAAGAIPIVVIPEFQLSTEKARQVLPQSYSRSDTIYNVQRSALTIAALTTGKWGLLREAMRDRIHQPYRLSLIPGLEEILDLDLPGLYGLALSGAGPAIFGFAEGDSAEGIGNTIIQIFKRHGLLSGFHRLAIDTKGRSLL
jgi:homoserine kinase